MRHILPLAALLLSSTALAGPPPIPPAAPFPIHGAASQPWQMNGVSIQSIFLGLNAGKLYPLSTEASGYAAVGIGSGALQSLGITNSEMTCIGTWTCQYATTGSGATAIGDHAIGSDLAPVAVLGIGNDALRDAMVAGGVTEVVAVGNQAAAHGSPGAGTVAFGFQALRSNSSVIVLGGTKTTGDVLTLTMAGSGGGVTGLPIAPAYTVLSGDTLATIATGLYNAIQAVAAGVTSPSYPLAATGVSTMPDGTYAIPLQFPGSGTTGWAMTITPTCSGTCTETLTIGTGSTGSENTAIGEGAEQGPALTTAQQNVAVGYHAGLYLTTGSFNLLGGTLAGSALTTGHDNVLLGETAGEALVTNAYLVAIGSGAGIVDTGGQSVIIGGAAGAVVTSAQNETIVGNGTGSKVTGGSNTIIGAKVATTTLTTGSLDVVIGVNASCDATSTAESNAMHFCTGGGDLIHITNGGTPSAAVQTDYGSIVFPNLTSDSGKSDATVCDVTASGTLYYGSGTGGICLTTSTRRAKTDIAPEQEGLEQVMALEPVGFNYKPGHGFDPAHRYNGFIAEDMAPVLPKLVGRDAEGKPNSVDMMGLVPVLVKAMQQQQREIDELKAELRAAHK